MKIVIVSVGLSPNIGDQLIAKTLGSVIEKNDKNDVTYIDLHHGLYDIEFSQREISLSNYTPNKEKLNKKYTPRLIKSLLTCNPLSQETKVKIKESDLVIIGGGHLLIDNYFDFMIRIINHVTFAKKHNKKIIFWSVGVGTKHTIYWKLAAKYFLKGIPIYTRDSKSEDRVKRLGLNAKGTNLDPAFFTSNIFDGNIGTKSNSISIFIMDPYEMNRHSDYRVSRELATKWWCSIIAKAIGTFDNVTICNNGSMSDYFFIKKFIVPELEKLSLIEKCVISPRVLKYDQLINNVKMSEVIIAQRLHAIIPSVSFGKKVIGIKWDSKVTDIVSDIGMEDILVSYENSTDDIFKLIENYNVSASLESKKNEYLRELSSYVDCK
ncbi:polysaccharide pyruvyl transferase family protein [Vibrio cholerae]